MFSWESFCIKNEKGGGMQEFEPNCSVIDADFETIKHQGNIRAEGGNTEDQQKNSKKKKGILRTFLDGIISFMISILLIIPVLLMLIVCFVASVLEVPFKLLK